MARDGSIRATIASYISHPIGHKIEPRPDPDPAFGSPEPVAAQQREADPRSSKHADLIGVVDAICLLPL